MIIDLGTFAVPATGTAPPVIPSLNFGSDVVGYFKVTLSGPGAGDFFFFSQIPAVAVANIAQDTQQGFDQGRGGVGGVYFITTLPADTVVSTFNQSANAYTAALEFHVVGSADITLQP